MECQWLTSLSAGNDLQIFRRLNQGESAGDGLALNRLALARNGCGLQVNCMLLRKRRPNLEQAMMCVRLAAAQERLSTTRDCCL